ncbi:MAG: hypothetical protein DMD27_04815 [Gemmatimonadetes bacterium]|nr:MAG: hypothetical protein DMD27_04815 [Gemmatimonadota bacterium]
MLVVAAALLLQSPSDSSALRHAGGRAARTMTAVRIEHPPVLDGKLDDPAWHEAKGVGGFIETDPREESSPAESTTVMIVYDDAAVYVGARLYDAEPARISRRLGRRDDDTQSDMFYVDFDSYHDHRTAFEFAVNPAGVKQDDICSNDFFIGDRSWDPVWDVATTIDSLGWVVEMRIPFSQLRFPHARDQVWGVNFFRWVFRKNERSQWAFQRKTETGYASRFGHLVGLHAIPAPKRLEVLPYTLGRGTFERPVFGSPFDRGHSYFGGAGLDVKYGVTSNLTLDAAVNPDFGQVESDPAFVNLTTVEQFLQERRPFFVEGASIFNFGGTGPYIQFGNTPQYFYSRRIGRTPSLEPEAPPGGFIDVPTHTTILGAAKLSGKTPSGWSVGVLDAVTARERASFASGSSGWHEDVEPFTNYVVGRVRREVGGHTGFGFLATAVDRRNNSAALDSLRGGGYVAAADFYHRWANNAYSVYASLGASHVTGDTLAMRLTQEQPTRYYQRPDAPYLSRLYDPRRTSLSGVGADFSINKEGGNSNWGFALSTTTPGFEVNDLGFQRRTDRTAGDLFVGHRWTKPGRVFRQASIGVDPLAFAWNYGGDRIQFGRDIDVFGQLLNYWSANVFVYQQQRGIDDRLTRGGPAAVAPAQWQAGVTITSDTRQPVNGTLNTQYFRDAGGTWSFTVSPVINLRPSAAVSLQIGPSYVRGFSAAQFVTSRDDAAATATYGARYVFGELSQRQLDLTTRLNLTFTPTLSFQLYAQPFTFAGRYANFKELETPRTFNFTLYGRDNGSTISYDPGTAVYTVHPAPAVAPTDSFQFSNPDSRVRSFRSNAVLRWEYRPGSTVFFVWSQSRFVSLLDPTLDLGHYLGHEMFLDPPTNVLLVKFNYWLSL